MKSDEDNATGDVQLLCKLFSGERSSYHYSTEDTRHIPANTAFSILGSIQLLNAAKLIAKMDHGHGLIDRILFATPLAFRPTLSKMEAAKTDLSTEVISDFDELFQNIHNIDHNTEYTSDEDAIALLRETIDQFVAEVNDAIQDGKVPPKSKTPELISFTPFQILIQQPRDCGPRWQSHLVPGLFNIFISQKLRDCGLRTADHGSCRFEEGVCGRVF